MDFECRFATQSKSAGHMVRREDCLRKVFRLQNTFVHLTVARVIAGFCAFHIDGDLAASLARGRIETDVPTLDSESSVYRVQHCAQSKMDDTLGGIQFDPHWTSGNSRIFRRH